MIEAIAIGSSDGAVTVRLVQHIRGCIYEDRSPEGVLAGTAPYVAA
jgi:hypothetical protein